MHLEPLHPSIICGAHLVQTFSPFITKFGAKGIKLCWLAQIRNLFANSLRRQYLPPQDPNNSRLSKSGFIRNFLAPNGDDLPTGKDNDMRITLTGWGQLSRVINYMHSSSSGSSIIEVAHTRTELTARGNTDSSAGVHRCSLLAPFSPEGATEDQIRFELLMLFERLDSHPDRMCCVCVNIWLPGIGAQTRFGSIIVGLVSEMGSSHSVSDAYCIYHHSKWCTNDSENLGQGEW